MQARAAAVNQVLYGTYAIPDSADQPIDIVINPMGEETRSQKRYEAQLEMRMNLLRINV